MNRDKIQELISWKKSPSRKPLIIRGARQVGKTWLMKEFGKNHYSQIAYINFEKNKRLHSLFKDDFDIHRIIVALQAETGITINEETLIILDEIQEVPSALTALKYFCEDAPQYHVISAGSLIGVALHSSISFPVGKVDFMDLYPMTFGEFLDALGENSYGEMIKTMDWQLLNAYKTKFIERLKQYFFVGGMPEAILTFLNSYNYTEVRDRQKNILAAYEQDFSKHAPIEIVPRIRMLWNSVPAQLAKENRKFLYGIIKQGARAKDYELALSWLSDSGLVHKIHRVSKPGMPLKAYEDRSAFKLYLSDIGLLCAMGDLNSKVIIDGNNIFTEFKGALTEQYVAQSFLTQNKFQVYYWTSERARAEVDFILQIEDQIYPVEVKAEENLQAKSLKVYKDKFNPLICFRTSMSDFRHQDWLVNIPLYSISEILKVL
jgi:uncharacterized protein